MKTCCHRLQSTPPIWTTLFIGRQEKLDTESKVFDTDLFKTRHDEILKLWWIRTVHLATLTHTKFIHAMVSFISAYRHTSSASYTRNLRIVSILAHLIFASTFPFFSLSLFPSRAQSASIVTFSTFLFFFVCVYTDCSVT